MFDGLPELPYQVRAKKKDAWCPTYSQVSNEWESDHRVDCRRLKPAQESINQPTQDSAVLRPGLTYRPSRKAGLDPKAPRGEKQISGTSPERKKSCNRRENLARRGGLVMTII
jgi:hypothetical protein